MRRPAKLERAGALTPRDRMWAAMRLLQGSTAPWSPLEVQFIANRGATAPIHVDSVSTYARGLAHAKPPYVERVIAGSAPGRKCAELHLFRLVRDVGAHAPRVNGDGNEVIQGIGRQQMWNVLRRERGDFSFHDLAFRASTHKHPVAPQEAKKYVHFLSRAGYLRRVANRRSNGRGRIPEASRYVFVRTLDTGPRAPLITKLKEVIDGNSGTVIFTPTRRNGGHDGTAR